MRLLEEVAVSIEIRDLSRRTVLHSSGVKPPPRSKGIHLSGVLKYVMTRTGLMKPGDPLEDELPLRMAMGLAWEEFAASMYPEICWQPGELEVDGVFMTPDGVSGEYPPIQTEEFKLTWKKARIGLLEIQQDFYWMHQIRSYCHALGTRVARLHVLYVNGSYRPSEPLYYRYLLEFTPQEIRDTWNMVQKNKEFAEPE